MLRNLLSVCAFVLLGSVAASGQIAVGVKGSLQLSTITITPNTLQPSSLVGFQAGLMLDLPITDEISLRPQLLYSVKGAKQSASAQGVTVEQKAMINYLEVPVQITYGFEAGDGRVVIGAGPYLGYGLSGSSVSTFNGQSETTKFTFDDKDDLKRIDVGLHLSAGYELSSGLLVSGYFSPGLTNISSDKDVTAKTSAYGLSLGYFFGGR